MVRRCPQVCHRLSRDIGRCGHRATIEHLQAPPVQPSDAPGTVPPRNPRSEFQLSGSVPVATRLLDLAADLPQPAVQRVRTGLGVELRNETLGADEQAAVTELVVAWEGPTAGEHIQVQAHGSSPWQLLLTLK